MSFVLLGILNSQASAGFDPASLNPDLWLDASDASTITESGGSVSQWNNKGTLENLTQAASADQPTTGVTTLNGLNVIDFNEEFLLGSTASQWKFLHDGTNYFFCMVVKKTGAGVRGYFGTSDTGADIGLTFFGNGEAMEFAVTTGATRAVKISDSSFVSSTDFEILSSVVDPDNGTAEDRIDYYADSTQGTVTNTNTASPSTSNPTNNFGLAIMGSAGGTSQSLIGSIGELIIVSGADATETNRQTVVNYLNDKWSVF